MAKDSTKTDADAADAESKDTAKTAAEEEAKKAPFGYDIVGEDGRRVARSLPAALAADERGRIQAKTGEKLDIVVAEAPPGAGEASDAKPIPEPKKPVDPRPGSSSV